MKKYQQYYRSSDGEADYEFIFEQISKDSWRIYIEDQPSYQGRESGPHSTHRFSSWGRKYICWTTKIRTLEEALEIAAEWADNTQNYINHGIEF